MIDYERLGVSLITEMPGDAERLGLYPILYKQPEESDWSTGLLAVFMSYRILDVRLLDMNHEEIAPEIAETMEQLLSKEWDQEYRALHAWNQKHYH